MEPLNRPKISLGESVRAVAKGARVETYPLRGILNGASLVRAVQSVVDITKTNIARKVLHERMPFRNSDGSFNWKNYFAVAMMLDRPVTREEIFPDGTDGLTREDILKRAQEYMKPNSLKFNFAPQTTNFDPVELPEVIDDDFQPVTRAINFLPFARTVNGCSGHIENPRGFERSGLAIVMDGKNERSMKFVKAVEDLCSVDSNHFSSIECSVTDDGEMIGVHIRLWIEKPENWDETSSYFHSDHCRNIRDGFWEQVQSVAESFQIA